MASVAAVRAAITTSLTGITGLQTALGGRYDVSAYPASNPAPPQVEVAEFSIEKHAAMANGAEWWTCVINAYVALTSQEVSRQTADAFLNSDPLTAALEANRTLGGLVSDLIVDRATQRDWRHPSMQQVLTGVEYQVRILV